MTGYAIMNLNVEKFGKKKLKKFSDRKNIGKIGFSGSDLPVKNQKSETKNVFVSCRRSRISPC